MPEKFKSPNTKKSYESAVNEIIENNASFSEKMIEFNPLAQFSNIQRIFIDAGPEKFQEFERAFETGVGKLKNLLNLQSKDSRQQQDAERYIEEFFETDNTERRAKLIGFLKNCL